MILLMYFIHFALAAWPDVSEGRQAAVQILREDVGNGFPMLSGTERIRAYESVCRMKKPYYPICFYKDWTDEQGKTDINNLAKNFGHSTEPLAQVVNAWQLGFSATTAFAFSGCDRFLFTSFVLVNDLFEDGSKDLIAFQA